MEGLPAISLEGPKGVGKTETAQRRAHSAFLLDEPEARELLAADPKRLDTSTPPVLIDEWQRHPAAWDLVRRSVDRDPRPGRFLLTGSATPTTAPTHSGAGRIVRVRMRPMALAERGVETPTVSLRDLLSGHRPAISGDTAVDLPTYTEEILRSGFPAIRALPPRARRAQLDGYLARIVEHDFPEQGHLVRRPTTLRAWLTAYAAATATTASYNAILDAATPGDTDKPTKPTTIGYRDVLHQLWLLEPISGWTPTHNAFTRLMQAPKHHLADPALAARLLGATEGSLLAGDSTKPPIPRDGTLLGALFESLVALSLQVYAQANETTVHHLRTRNGDHEVDFIIERDDHKVVALEVKLSTTIDDSDVRHLRWLGDRLGPDLLDAAILTTGRHAYRRPDGIAVIPAALLGP
ncbi:MAG: ATP-binding protein [Longispora sp.]|nr:ATP-binding protein [Longispora sp. (in: high G+C Gram-positive bacteria)]